MNTRYSNEVLKQIRKETAANNAAFEATGADAEIGIISNIPGTYTVNTLNGKVKQTFNNVAFDSKLDALVAFARQYGTGKLKKTSDPERFLIYLS